MAFWVQFEDSIEYSNSRVELYKIIGPSSRIKAKCTWQSQDKPILLCWVLFGVT